MPRFKYRDGVAQNVVAISYATLGHAAALALLFARAWPPNLIGVALSAHTLMVAAYLMHEAIHETIFASHAENDMLGRVVAFLAGGAWAGYAELRKKHLHHHSDLMDPTTFDFRGFLERAPRLVARVIELLEWCHVPAIEVLLRGEHALRPFLRTQGRRAQLRVLLVALVSLVWWGALWLVSPRAFVLYALSYLLFVVGLRVFDAFHHTFDLVVLPDYDAAYVPPDGRGRLYEHAHTFSNVIVRGRPAFNVLVLNFAYHNAHHAKPGVPWHRLPELDRTLYRGTPRQERAIGSHLRDFHRYRLERIRRDATAVPAESDQAPVNIGAVAVSLLTL